MIKPAYHRYHLSPLHAAAASFAQTPDTHDSPCVEQYTDFEGVPHDQRVAMSQLPEVPIEGFADKFGSGGLKNMKLNELRVKLAELDLPTTGDHPHSHILSVHSSFLLCYSLLIQRLLPTCCSQVCVTSSRSATARPCA